MHAATNRAIVLEGVRVHNLQNVNLQLPLNRLIVITGVSGSGKSSLAFDTLYAEGQRRYIETFSAYARQFLNPLGKPDADRIEALPPAIAVRQNTVNLNSRSTVATATELNDYWQLLFAKLGTVVCPECERVIHSAAPDDVLSQIRSLPDGSRLQIGFPTEVLSSTGDLASDLIAQGFTRLIAGDRTIEVSALGAENLAVGDEVWVSVDRLTAGRGSDERILDSLDTAFQNGHDRCILLSEAPPDAADVETATIDGQTWRVERFSGFLRCESCGREFTAPEPRLFSAHSPLGACPTCEGFGTVPAISFEHLVPDSNRSLREGAILPWTTPAYRHELDELLELADDYGIPVDVPFSELAPRHLELIERGVPERNFGGLQGFFQWLERHRYKLSVRVFLNRWRTYETCPDCNGSRLQPQALAVRVGGFNIADVMRMTVGACQTFLDQLQLSLTPEPRQLVKFVLPEILARLEYLHEVGLAYLTLDRTVRTLSGGEAQRVALTAALGSSLVNTLYVLDEPSAGLHPQDSRRVIRAIQRLRDAGNTVVVVEHEPDFVRAADHVVDIGPGAGREGGHVVFSGTPHELKECADSITGQFLSGVRAVSAPDQQRTAGPETIRLENCTGRNLRGVSVEFPLNVLCVVTGVSGSGKSTLIVDTLYPALARALKQTGPLPPELPYGQLAGHEFLDEVLLVDQQSIGRSSRSNPVTYLKAFDTIRQLFAETPEAQVRNFGPGHFSFNSAGGGRCPECKGHGLIEIDMQFLADVTMTCPACQGRRYRREILDVKYRGLSIAEVLDLTIEEAFTFFRGQRRLQKQLQPLKSVGLHYLPLGQPVSTLSGGESQRLKLAARLAAGTRSRTLFLLDEPTTGLHPADVEQLLECLQNLLAVGHSLIVIEHDLDIIRAADYVVDLGPAAGNSGGQIVACGTPEEIAAVEASVTGGFLRGESN